jgi:hypothetical protein
MYLLQHVYGITTVTALVGREKHDCKVDMLMPSHKWHPKLTPHLTARNPPFDRTTYKFSQDH